MNKSLCAYDIDIFTKIFSEKKKKLLINIYKIIILTVLLGLLVLTVFHFSSHKLLGKSFIELFDSIVYYFKSMFSEETISKENVSFLTFDESIIESVIPADIRVFGYRFLAMFELMVNKDFLKESLIQFGIWLGNFANVVLIMGMPITIFFVVYYNFIIFKEKGNSLPSDISKPLSIFLSIRKVVFLPIKRFLIRLWREFRESKLFFRSFIVIVLYNINAFSFIMIFLAWYFYFVFSLDFISLWYLLCKFLICISPLFEVYFWPLWGIAISIIIIRAKLKSGYNKLNQMYDKNDEFIEGLGIITGIYGGPGAGKTSLEVAIATQKEVQLRTQAYDSMMEIRSEFPDFPFRELENEVEQLSSTNKAVNKIQIEHYFREKFQNAKKIYTYNLKTNKFEHYDQLKVSNIVDELCDYAQLYYIYISSLAASSYSLRYDRGLELGNAFPSLQYHFFTRDFRNDDESQNAKIFNLNLLRLNKQVNRDQYVSEEEKNQKNPITLIDYGIVTLSEFGKDRGNRYTNLSRKDRDVTPSSDGTGNMFGLIRHATTVRHKQYGFIIWDEQKLSAFSGSEAAMAETNIFVTRQNDSRLALPFWQFESVILEWGSSSFNNLYTRYIQLRNDQTLFSYFVAHARSFFNNLIRNINNTFGYRRMKLDLSRANVNGAQVSKGDTTFFMMNKIVYANRYSTDCYKGFFDKLKMQATQGINQFPSFKGHTASIKELLETNGYFSLELLEALGSYVEENKAIMNSNKGGDK